MIICGNFLNENMFSENQNKDIKYEKIAFLRIFYIFLINIENTLYTFAYQHPLELKPLKICLLLFNISSDIPLNAFFYLSDNISEKYHYKGSNQFLFSLTNNLTISVVSGIVGYILIFIFQNLVQSTDQIKKLFEDEEDLMKKDKEYKVDNCKKRKFKQNNKYFKSFKNKNYYFLCHRVIINAIFLILYYHIL